MGEGERKDTEHLGGSQKPRGRKSGSVGFNDLIGLEIWAFNKPSIFFYVVYYHSISQSTESTWKYLN